MSLAGAPGEREAVGHPRLLPNRWDCEKDADRLTSRLNFLLALTAWCGVHESGYDSGVGRR